MTSFTDTQLPNGTTYYYKVSAVNARRRERPVQRALRDACRPRPARRRCNSATAATAASTLAWTAPASNGGAAITGYKVYRGTTSGGETLLDHARQRHDASTDTAASSNGTTYYYKVSALNSVGEGALSNEQLRDSGRVGNASRARRHSTPRRRATEASRSPGALRPPTAARAVTGYKVYRGTTSGGETLLTTLGNVTSFTDDRRRRTARPTTTRSAPSTRSARARCRASGPQRRPRRPRSPARRRSTRRPAAAAASRSPGARPRRTAAPPITGYKVYRGTTSGGETLLTTLGNVTALRPTPAVTNGTTYYYKVSAVNGIGEGSLSNEKSRRRRRDRRNGARRADAELGHRRQRPASRSPGARRPPTAARAITGYKVYRGTTSGGETLLDDARQS